MDTQDGQSYGSDVEDSMGLIDALRGLVSLVLRSGEGITDLSARVHLHFSHLPWLSGTPVKPSLDYAPFPYRVTHRVFEVLRRWIDTDGDIRRLLEGLKSAGIRRLLGVMNGVVGDKLDRWDNPLALGMSLLDENGRAVLEGTDAVDIDGDVIIFLHGLCMHENDWESRSHTEFIERVQEKGYTPLRLRYNSGRAIARSGRSLDETLGHLDHCLPDNSSIILVGHSMGGLVIRSACEWARREKSRWLDRLTHSVYLGSPHYGAPLEQLGRRANSLLGLLPFTAPFMALGMIRSRGIRDLRHGTIAPWSDNGDGTLPFHPESADHLLMAGTLGTIGQHTPVGDGLVPLRSALAREVETGHAEPGGREDRVHFQDLGHFQLLTDPRVYRCLETWLENTNRQSETDPGSALAQ